jgi:RNA polymerase sigma-70 factor (ECF subfamily)
VTDEPPALDLDLALRAQAGDKRAFDQLVTRHKAGLYRLVRRSIGDEHDAYDILQDSFVSAWLALRRYDPTKPFLTWVRAIVLNKCRDHGRRLAVRRRILKVFALEQPRGASDIAAQLQTEREALDATRLRRLDQAISGLPSFYKEPLLLTAVTGLSQQEAAAQLNTTTKAIEMRIRRAKKKLTEALSDLAGEG